MDDRSVTILLEMIEALNCKLDATNSYLKTISLQLAHIKENMQYADVTSQLTEISNSLEAMSEGYSLKDVVEHLE
ncbi:MAG TPA: hypothetical protein IAD47_05775 [Candidatus Limihabitans stercoravium]|nr:hypothetical protein [Candidatus Limihabitans stercoravium]